MLLQRRLSFFAGFFLLVLACYHTNMDSAFAVEADGPEDMSVGAVQPIVGELNQIKYLERRIEHLAEAGIPPSNYHLTKAGAWLWFALDEHTVGGDVSVVRAATHEAVVIIEQLEARSPVMTTRTAVIPGSMKIRDDLWEKAFQMKQHKGFQCAGPWLAKLDVQLVWAGYKQADVGWRHARPYLQAAERYANEAEAALFACS